MAEFTAAQRKMLVAKGQAKPDGSYPIRNKSDLRNAIMSFGRGGATASDKAWIIKRAKELNALDMLPDGWLPSTAQHSDVVDDFLVHHGVLGMHWGVRKQEPSGVSDRTNREARADAKEYTQAKMYYGKGAGTRRKLINAKVASKSKNPEYKKAFDYHVANTNMEKRVSQAKSKRHRADAAAGTARTARGIKNVITGNAQFATLSAITIAAGATYAHQKGYDKMAFNAVKNSQYTKRGATVIKNLISRR